MRRGIFTGCAAASLASLALSAVPASAGPVRMCDGTRSVIAQGIGCAEAFWLADQARAGRQVPGWSVQAGPAGVVRLRRGQSWIKLRRVPRKAVAGLLIAGLSITHRPPPAADGTTSSDTLTLCADGLMNGVSASGRDSSPARPAMGVSSLFLAGSWTPAYVGEWRGGRTLELDVRMLDAGEWMGLAWAQRVRLELRDDGTGRMTTAAGIRAVTWTRPGCRTSGLSGGRA